MADVGGPGQGNECRPKKRLKALTEFVLSGGLDDNTIPPPQPVESIISVVCETFNCTPDVAIKQDMTLVRKILDVRVLEAAKAQHNSDVKKMTEDQTKLWMEAMESLNG